MSWIYSIKEALSALQKSKFSGILSIFSMAFSLFFLGVFILTIFQGWSLMKHLKSQIEMEVFLKDAADQKIFDEIQSNLNKQKEIQKITFISRERALSDLQKEFDENIADLLGENPLPASFRIKLYPEFHQQERVKQLQQKIQSWRGIDEVVYRYELLRTVQRYLRVAIILALILGSTLVVASIFLISNTIRLSIMVKRESIHIMSLVGATPSFIRRPFVMEGAIQGAIGAGLAIGGMFLLIKILHLVFPGIDIHYGPIIYGLFIWGTFLGGVGSWIALQKYLKL